MTSTENRQHVDAFRERGFVIVPHLIPSADLDALRREADACLAAAAESGGPRRGGARIPLDRSRLFADLAEGDARALATTLLGAAARPVKLTLFDKTEQANWVVPWHQDLTLQVRACRDVEGFGPWSVKDGIPHVQAPAAILERMVAIRVHLDDTPADNGALRVVPGSHRHGRLDDATTRDLRAQLGEHTCTVPAGGAHAMSPLLLHASSKSAHPAHRRVLHIDYTAVDLPGGLAWL